jgi:hypothetical protein
MNLGLILHASVLDKPVLEKPILYLGIKNRTDFVLLLLSIYSRTINEFFVAFTKSITDNFTI